MRTGGTNVSLENPEQANGRILVVDDNPDNLQVLMKLLTENGFVTFPASEGELALRFVQSTPPDLLLLDIIMPGMDGYEVCRRLKADARTREIPVIFMTALSEIEDKVTGFKLGAVDYVTKPFQADEALARVRSHVALHTMQKRLEEQNQQLHREIAERRRAEEALQKAHTELEKRVEERTADLAQANRMLNILSECSLALIRATEEPALLQEVCRIIIDLGGYPLVWIGYAEQDDARSVRPMAQAGFEEGYLDTIAITWDDTARGRGPTGTAIRTGEPCIAKDIQTDPRFDPWREKAVRRNYASSIALPLKCDGRVFGALNIYAAVPDAFPAEEVRLLLELAGNLAFGITSMRERTARRRAEEALRQSEEKYRTVADFTYDWEYWQGPDGRFIYVSPSCERITGYRAEEFLQDPHLMDRIIHPHDLEILADHKVDAPVDRGDDSSDCALDFRIITRSGEERWIGHCCQPVFDMEGQYLGLRSSNRDITRHRHAEQEQEKLQVQLLQSQKMELVGRLAGGVAHDFNNILAVILGNAELALMKVAPSDPLHIRLHRIEKAARRSAELVRQLLAFARNQTISPVVLNLNETVPAMLTLLRRVIGEDIVLDWAPAMALWLVKLDPSQIDQVLTNLCINARDAISGVGSIRIETDNIIFEKDHAVEGFGVVRGEYVLLSVSDDGCGMDQEIQAHLFEPFFTTKCIGEGTGLGLATVYGIVTQNNGFIDVFSEPGKGATFKIYFPRQEQGPQEAPSALPPPQADAGGRETVLLVEDEAELLDLCQAMLRDLGYEVLSACTPTSAIQIAQNHAGDIDLLITDVVMPEMNGSELVKHMQAIYPNLKHLYMSGYTANIIANRGVLDSDLNFIQKPFAMNDLAGKVRNILEK
jgi:PAS domain S-box-containing protein